MVGGLCFCLISRIVCSSDFLERMQTNTIEKWIKAGIAATFFVPLIVLPNTYIFPFIVPKILTFRVLTLLLLGGYILLFLGSRRTYRPRLTAPTIAVLLFLLSFTISTFVGVDWYRSFWDNHERMLGLFTVVHYALYYLIVTSVIREWRDWRTLCRVFLLAGGAVMIIGLLQKINPELLVNMGNNRVQSTLGNSIYVGGYGLFLTFLGYLLFIKEQKKEWKYVAAVCGLLGIAGVFASGTRGALIALLFGIFVLCVSYLITLRGHKKMQRTLVVILLSGTVLLGVAFLFRDTPFVRNIPALGRLVNTDFDRNNTRFMAWGVALDAWQDKPVFGWGPNNYYFAFNWHYRPEFLRHGWGETWFDNAHNVIMNTLAVQGTVGIVVYLGLFGAPVVLLWRRYRQGKLDVHLTSVGTAFLLAHLVSVVFVFENPTSYLYFFFFLAMVNSWTLPEEERAGAGKQIGRVSAGAVVTACVVVLFFIYTTDVRPAQANKTALLAIRAARENRIQQSMDYFTRALSFGSPHSDDIRNDYARHLSEVTAPFLQGNRFTDDMKDMLVLAHDEVRKNYDIHPKDIRIHLIDAQLSAARAQVLQEGEWLTHAKDRLEDALTHSPKRQQVQYMLAVAYLRVGDSEGTVRVLQESIENDPKVDEGWWRLAAILDDAGETVRAQELIAEAERQGVVFKEQGREVIGKILEKNVVADGEGNASP